MSFAVRSAVHPDQLTNQALLNEVQRLSRIIEGYESEKTKAEGEAQAKRLREHEDTQRAAEKKIEDQRDLLNRLNVPRPKTSEGFRALDWRVKSALISAFSSDFPAEVAAFERSGLDSWEDWDKLHGRTVAQATQPKIEIDREDTEAASQAEKFYKSV